MPARRWQGNILNGGFLGDGMRGQKTKNQGWNTKQVRVKREQWRDVDGVDKLMLKKEVRNRLDGLRWMVFGQRKVE